VLSLIERLPEGSKTASLMQSKEHWRAYMDIAPNYYVLAGIFNAINGNTAATGNFKKRPKFEAWPTPRETVRRLRKKADRPRTVADLYRVMTHGKT
jgi:hypothetical protein